jgi:hypothetical protein
VLQNVVAGAAVAREALYGRRDERTDPGFLPPERQSERAIACSDELWDAFAALAREEGASIEWLINDAMKAYLQQREGPVAPSRVTLRDSVYAAPRERNTPTAQRAYLPRAPGVTRRPTPHPFVSVEGDAPEVHLSVVLEGVRYAVTKERFVLGRAGRSSDLAIDDPGVSRQHALIERAGGTYYLVDMGSTNGVEFEGERIARKQIAHGDRFRIGDHEIVLLLG